MKPQRDSLCSPTEYRLMELTRICNLFIAWGIDTELFGVLGPRGAESL